MDTIICLTAGPLFLISLAAHIYVKLRLRPKAESGFDEYYHEFEDRHTGLAKYTRWSRITFIAAAVAALLLFLAAAI